MKNIHVHVNENREIDYEKIIYGIKKGLEIANSLDEFTEKTYELPIRECDLSAFDPKPLLLDIGGAGEYTIMKNTKCKMCIIDKNVDELINNSRVQTYEMDAQQMTFESERFESVSAFYSFFYMDDIELKNVMKETHRVLKKEGHLYIWDVCFEKKELDESVLVPVKLTNENGSKIHAFVSSFLQEGRNEMFYKNMLEEQGFAIQEFCRSESGVYIKCMRKE